jgi:hypothetical protein
MTPAAVRARLAIALYNQHCRTLGLRPFLLKHDRPGDAWYDLAVAALAVLREIGKEPSDAATTAACREFQRRTKYIIPLNDMRAAISAAWKGMVGP